MEDVFDPYFRGLDTKETKLLEVLTYDLVERGFQIDLDNFHSYLRVLERLPDVFRQVMANFKDDHMLYKESVSNALRIIHQEPDEDVIRQLAIFRSFLTKK